MASVLRSRVAAVLPNAVSCQSAVRSSKLSKQQGSLTTFARNSSSSISALQAAFRDPSSPFHIPPGSKGPESPDSPPSQAHLTTLASESVKALDPLEEAHEKLRHAGFDPESFWEQRVVWGDHDSFQHVNNVRYVRFFESARIQWMMSLGREIGGPVRAKAMINGEGVSLILKSIEVQFRRPVTYPDTLLIGYRPMPSTHSHDTATFHVTASAYSVAQKAFVAHSKEALVWYDYDQLKKCDPGERAREVLKGRMTKESDSGEGASGVWNGTTTMTKRGIVEEWLVPPLCILNDTTL